MFGKLKKKRIRREYENATKALQLSLYEVIKSILKDELHEEYSIDQIGRAAAITVNNLGLRPESRQNPLHNNDNLAKAQSLNCSDFEMIYNMLDIDKT